MAIVTSNDVVEISVKGRVGGRPWASIWHMRTDIPITDIGDELPAVVEDFRDNWQDHMTGGMDAGVQIDEFSYMSLDSPDGEVGVVLPDQAKATTGAQAGTHVPANTAFLIRKLAAGGRGTRTGRAYLPGVRNEDVGEDGSVVPAHVTYWNQQLQLFLDGVSDTSILGFGRYPVVVRRPAPAREAGQQIVEVPSHRIRSLVLDGRVATQRRRLRK